MRQEAWEAGMKGLEALLQIRENADRKIEDLYRQLHEIGYFSDGKGGGVYPDCWDEVDDNWSALPDLNRGPPDGHLANNRSCYFQSTVRCSSQLS